MHLSWGMHNDQYHYAKSTGPVTTPGQAIAFGPDLGTMTGNESIVTYPEFVNLPDGDLLYFYRKGISGDGDLRLNRYDNQAKSWSAIQLPLIDGTVAGDPSSSNAYWNTPIVDSAGRLHLSWLYRWNANTVNSFTGFQTNHDIMYAVSDDQGATWKTADGTPYGLPITQATSDVVVPVAQGSSLINTTSMAVDTNDRPVIATWWAPQAGAGNHVRQYALAWFDGADWQTSQITSFDTDYDGGNSRIPESQLPTYRLTRPVVLVTDDDRVLVLFADYRMGNKLMMAHSVDRITWEFLELDDTIIGHSELAIDTVRWERDGIISMLYQPTGLGSATETLSLFEFDVNAYFAAVPEPSSLGLLTTLAMVVLLVAGRRVRGA